MCSRRYFTLWLREYTVKYNQWAASYKAKRDRAGEHRVNWSVPSSSHLAMFYARAKQTFFMPNSTYELNLPSKYLAPFHASDGSLHPDPLIFTDVAVETQQMLQESLHLFVQAQLNNVGNSRVICGIIAGISTILVLCVPFLTTNFTLNYGRWARLAAFPGMWVGLTIVLAAFNGICMGVYLFGDLRQLHKFELSRPPISKPRPVTKSLQPSVISSFISSPPPTNPILPITQPPRLSIIPAPPPAHLASRRSPSCSTLASESSSGSSSGFTHEVRGVGIDISPAIYDVDSVNGPAMSPVTPEAHLMFSKREDENDDSFTTTATFIHPYDSNDDYDYKPPADEGQALSPFDFDALPPRLSSHHQPPQYHILGIKPEADEKSHISPVQLLGRFQEKCSVKWRVSPATINDEEKQAVSRGSSYVPYTSRQLLPPQLAEKSDASVLQQWKMVKAVPAFTQLTRVLSPVIVRGQWEIVVKSIVIAFIITWAILGGLLAIPPR